MSQLYKTAKFTPTPAMALKVTVTSSFYLGMATSYSTRVFSNNCLSIHSSLAQLFRSETVI